MLAPARILAGIAGSMVTAAAMAAEPPPLYFYPPEYRYASGHILNSPQTVSVAQATTDFPDLPGMAGIVLMIDWSTVCPSAGGCDFGLIDSALKYWGDRGKKIVLDVATINYPYMAPPDARETTSATPRWVMQRIDTYDYAQTRILGEVPQDPSQGFSMHNFTMPDFRDARFVALQADLIRELARRYDGHPGIAQMRIATGLGGEENPLAGPLVHPLVPHYHELEWLDYCRRITALYLHAFRKTELEFNISRLPWIRAFGSDADAAAVDAFIAELLSRHVLLGFEAWESADAKFLLEDGPTRNGIVQALRYLRSYKSKGGRIGIESFAPLRNPRMGTSDPENVRRLATAFATLEPDKLVLFGDVPRDLMTSGAKPPLKETHARELLRTLGYPLD
jgi:hypothetical protein